MIPRHNREHQIHMIDWLRSLLMIFYAPARGMREMRDRSLAPVAIIALAQPSRFRPGDEKVCRC